MSLPVVIPGHIVQLRIVFISYDKGKQGPHVRNRTSERLNVLIHIAVIHRCD
jgi:hypothetical protein